MTAVDVRSVVGEVRPVWRGRIHAIAFAVAIPAGVQLVRAAEHAAARVAAVVYSIGLLLGFGTSAAYHRLAHGERARRIMQRLDHSMIFVLIAGTGTPICLLALPPAWGVPTLCVMWAGALTGIGLKQFAFARFKYLEYALYPGLGWVIVVTLPALVHTLSPRELAFLLGGGLVYLAGVPVLRWNRPDPWPATFGYHEIWHAATVVGGVCHFVVVAHLVAG